MAQSTKTYRIYAFDARRHDISHDLIEAHSDEDAIAKAEAAAMASKCEIWDGTRLVAQLPGERRQA